MEGVLAVAMGSSSSSSSSSSSAHYHHHHRRRVSPLRSCRRRHLSFIPPSTPFKTTSLSSSSAGLFSSSSSSPVTIGEVDPSSVVTKEDKEEMIIMLPKVDKSGRFYSPRAARELALMILYAACLDGSDPVRLFEKRLNARRETGYEFDKVSLMEYNHMSFGGPPVTTHTTEEADEISRIDQKESDLEAEVLSAPIRILYSISYSISYFIFSRKLLVAVVDKWDSNVLAIDKVAPPNWKNEPASRILEFSVLHFAMSEIAVLGTRHQIVMNEAVDLAKRFFDGAAPRVINGCLRTFVKDLNEKGETRNLKIKQTV